MPLVSKAFGDIITFTRASTATYFDSTGTLQSAAIDAPRLDYDPSTLAAQGLLIEEARTNLTTRSEEFNDAAWTKTNSSITANSTTAPSATTTADTLVEDTATNFHYVQQTVSGTTNTNNYTLSCFIKASTRTAARIAIIEGTTFSRQVRATVDLSAGTVVGAALNSATLTAATITPVGNSWYRVTVAGVLGGTDTNILCAVYVGQDTATFSYTGNGTGAVFIWGAQLEAGAFPTSYIPTTTTALTRSADVASVNTLSPWYNQTEGTVYAELQSLSPLTAAQSVALNKYPNVWCIDAGTSDSSVIWYGVGAEIFISGAYNNIGTVPSGVNKFAVALAASGNQSSSSLNGAAAVNRSGSLSVTATQFTLGRDPGGTQVLNGYLRRIVYYPRRLSNAELQSITS